jgi:TIR domain
MSYINDVFISYKRDVAWTPWTRDHFKVLLQSYLNDDLGREPEIFIDERIEVGADWVDELGENLAKSKVVVALFSGSYFGSDWCVHELDLIVERARQFKSGFLPEARLIVPVVGHDGEQIPDPVSRIQCADVKDYGIAWINKNAPDYPEFSKTIKKLSPFVAKAVETAPAFDDRWIACCKKRFAEVYDASEKGTRLAPTQFTLKAAPPPTAPPQIKP